ncbi:MAG: hypothetical protein CMI90_05265 [Pelagibacteraceae bacterium]|nr:hypothetical protein [Pelagibacteraceae bacterium]
MYLKGKNILITGASYGLGALIAKELSKEGANLFLTARSESKLKLLTKNFKKKKNFYHIVDFQSLDSILKMTKKVKSVFKNIDVIMHIAGGGLGVSEYDPKHEDYMKVFNLNLFSIFEINRELLPLLKKKRRGTIFHVGSIASNEAVGSLSYNVSKAALSAYVRTLSKNVATYNICVNGINPGGFIYKGNAMDRLKKRNSKIYNNFINNRIPINRMPKAKELLPIIKMCIGENNIILTGNMLSCDSGEGNFYKSF